MKAVKNDMSVLIFLFALMGAASIWLMISYPLMRSAEEQQKRLLDITPLGAKMSDVEKLIRQKGWDIRNISLNVGFYKQEGPKSLSVGSKSIEAFAGSYRVPPYFGIITSVTYYWGFDHNGSLTEVWVRKDIDAP